MTIVSVIIEYSTKVLDRTFSYIFDLDGLTPELYTRITVPFRGTKIYGLILGIEEVASTEEELNEKLGYKLNRVFGVIDLEPLLSEELIQLAKMTASYYFTPLIKVIKSMLPPSLKPCTSAASKPKIKTATFYRLKANRPNVILTSLVKPCYEQLKLGAQKSGEQFRKKHFEKLVELGIAEAFEEEVDRNFDDVDQFKPPLPLTACQRAAYSSIVSSPLDTCLLFGVTGSGKTELYIKLINDMLLTGYGSLLLVSEISLSIGMVKILKERFKNAVAILHSGENDAVLYDEYRRVKKGKIKIVVGARNAIFAPVNNLGLIIIDEEHSTTYKQNSEPFYNAITIAKWRQQQNPGLKIILGSATPLVEDYARAEKNIYQLVTLEERINKAALPETTIVDLNDPAELIESSKNLSKTLVAKIKSRLLNNEQVILLLNRRGYASLVKCRDCGKVIKCPTCDIPLTEHEETKTMFCHHCEGEAISSLKCPYCGSPYLIKFKDGIEKVLHELEELFPEARIGRIDSDVPKKLRKETLDTFAASSLDILLGTQMISKGFDFEKVTLAAVINADNFLNIPSFRASEVAYDMMTQLIGRSGRGFYKGEAVIQTYSPLNPTIQLAAKQDYLSFYQHEMEIRKALQYPPFTYITMLTFLSASYDDLIEAVYNAKTYLVSHLLSKRVNIYGPAVPYIPKINSFFRRQIMLKYKNADDIIEVLNYLNETFKDGTTKIEIDIDSESNI